jgi:HD-GYP domain-containing protein (c-di-GMP phosphodiesterase class II)
MEHTSRLITHIEAIAAGDYSNDIMELTKDEHPEIIRRIAEAVGMMMVRIEAREMRLEQLYAEIKQNSLCTVQSIADALGTRDSYTRGHGQRVGDMAARTALRAGLCDADVESIRLAGILHDIGKIGFTDDIFSNEDTRPNDTMMERIRKHPTWGHDILANLNFLGDVPELVFCHHERLDGQGYPRGLKGDEIPRAARFISVADCYDAITTQRCYQDARTQAEACAILEELAGPSLDPDIVTLFITELDNPSLPESSFSEKTIYMP